ncbi:hypothetical protein [Winogradskyella flava]|uniref:YtxH domain-containing protein n=1 Tax=Winogradskyella flava TaxID=1884876 RepID=A0A842IPV2_9FLAO|nr:hypothetical protein [Winogradskyella flava]MBC2845030.1 hypothetical protein [Winogradskyella flava]
MKKLIYIFMALFSLSLMTTSCREQKSTGDKVEEAVDKASDAVEDVADDVSDEVEDLVDDNK